MLNLAGIKSSGKKQISDNPAEVSKEAATHLGLTAGRVISLSHIKKSSEVGALQPDYVEEEEVKSSNPNHAERIITATVFKCTE